MSASDTTLNPMQPGAEGLPAQSLTFDTIPVTNEPGAEHGIPLRPRDTEPQGDLFDGDGAPEPERCLIGAIDDNSEALSCLSGEVMILRAAVNRLAEAVEAMTKAGAR